MYNLEQSLQKRLFSYPIFGSLFVRKIKIFLTVRAVFKVLFI